ncbi:S-layer homology domain-containing protein [Cohnella caldifontis]|uniref:S-layer homology domain-containing protein n=1 Tax=Cohnella caldifontis TaxID=3027471 RepID=UPI0023EB0613|nr:S-layer homology domain-containing protein [Cohnella sp. YIM B05605]
MRAIASRRKGNRWNRPAFRLFLGFLLMLQPSLLLAPAVLRAAAPDGTESNPYIVTTAEQLKQIRNDMDAYYRLEADIDLTAEGNWTPLIGVWFESFTGHLDGQNHTISNLTVSSSGFYLGLFETVGTGGVIENLKLQKPKVTGSGFSYAGALAGVFGGTAENVHVSGGTVSSGSDAGGLFGQVQSGASIQNSGSNTTVEGTYYAGGIAGSMSGGTIENSTSEGTVKSTNAGGIVGSAQSTAILGSSSHANVQGVNFSNSAGGIAGSMTGGSVSESFADGEVSGLFNVGGLVGVADSVTIRNSFAKGAATADPDNGFGTGGLVGKLAGSTVQASYASGAVSGSSSVGGLTGLVNNSTISDSYATGTVSGVMGVGGLIGGSEFMSSPTAVNRSYASGKVSGDPLWGTTGGLIGDRNQPFTISSSYYDKDRTKQSDTGPYSGTPKTKNEMIDESKFTGWDFHDPWHLDVRDGAPTFIRYDNVKPIMSGAIVRDDTPDQVTVAFPEKIKADSSALSQFEVSVDGQPAAILSADLSGKTLTLALDQSIMNGQTVSVIYSDAAPITDKAGNRMDGASITAVNEVEPHVAVTSYSPADNSENVPVGANLVLTFNETVTAMPGKNIFIRNAAGTAVAAIPANSAGVKVEGNVVTIDPPANLSPLSGYSVRIESGAFQHASDDVYGGIAKDTTWNFMTEADATARWVQVGQAGFSPGTAEEPVLQSDGSGGLYTAFRDKAHGNKITVMKLDSALNRWVGVGTAGFSEGPVHSPSLAAVGGRLYAAFEETIGDRKFVNVMKYEETGDADWEQVGSPLPSGTVSEVLDGADSAPFILEDQGTLYLAYRDGARDDKATVMQYNGSGDWQTVGTPGFSVGDVRDPSLAVAEGTLYIAFEDYVFDADFGATVMKYDALSHAWESVGGRGFTSGLAFGPILKSDLDALYVGYANDSYQASVMQYDVNADRWNPVGSPGFSPDQAYGLTFYADNGELYAAYEDWSHHNRLTLMKYAGIRWVEVGQAGFTADEAYEPSIVVSGGVPYAAYVDLANQRKLSVMKYVPVLNEAPTVGQMNIEGNLLVGETVTGRYVYHDVERDPEGTSIYRWYAADNAAGKNKKEIPGATEAELILSADLKGKYLIFEVTPAATAGTALGTPTPSAAAGPVADPGGAPLAPTNVAAFAGDESVSLTWDPVPEADRYEIYMGTETRAYGSSSAATVTGATYEMTGLTNGTTYYFAVKSVRGDRSSDFSEEVSAVPGTLESRNADLSALAVSGVALSPAFRPEVTSYLASVSYGVGSVTVTASVYDSGAELRINGLDAVSGHPTDPIALHTGSNRIRIEVTAPDERTHKTYSVTIVRQEDDSSTDDEPEPDSPNEEPDNGLPVVVNGQTYSQIAKGTSRTENGRVIFTAAVDTSRLSDQLDRSGEKPVIVVPIAMEADEFSVALTGEAVKKLENKQAVLEIRTSAGNYRIPAAEMVIEQLALRLDPNAKLSDIEVRISIGVSPDAKTQQVQALAGKSNFSVVAPPVDFSVTASYGGRTVEADRFQSYVAREIPLPAGTDPSKITTAIVVGEDGSLRHVPTYIAKRGDQWYAVVNSLTNSTYTLIWHPTSFADMEKHWAKTAVHDLASRMIVSGMDGTRFEPDRPITRAEFAAIAIRALGLGDRGDAAPPFADMPAGSWYAGVLAQAYEYGLFRGYPDGTFGPDRTITREEAVTAAVRAMKLAGLKEAAEGAAPDDTLERFSDGAMVASWAKEAMAAAVRGGLVNGGADSRLSPGQPITRAETSVLFRQLLIKSGLINGN